ncbi:putative lipase [hydrothermal vent metagenome]|uniref:Putative lipase n=1 Tax=hydrothermal vent metagenome TaxID=652676 RepID=A0A3B0X9S9_9ZZZZ
MQITKIILAVSLGILLAACSDKDTALEDSLGPDATVDTISDLDYATSTIPFPNDLLFAPTPGVPSDGTLNIPVEDASDLSDPRVAMNGLDGFSTVAPISTGFTGAIDASSVSATSVRMYAVPISAPGGPITGTGTPLTYGVDYIAQLSSLDSANATLVIVPLKPLLPKTSYAVLLTNELKSSSGRAVGISGSYLLTRGDAAIYDKNVPPAIPPSTAIQIRGAIKAGSLQPSADATDEEVAAAGVSAFTLETIRETVSRSEDYLLMTDTTLSSADIILHWTFTTQSTTDVLVQTRTDIIGGAVPVSSFSEGPVAQSPLNGQTGFVGADLYVGELDVAYYLTAPVDTSDTGNVALASFWQGPGGSLLTYLGPNLSPVLTSTQTIPVMVSIPKAFAACPDGVKPDAWKVVIYQHGITSSRATMAAAADALANACLAVIAIDLPMHGITGNEENTDIADLKGIGAAGTPGSITERTFDLDLIAQDASGNTIGLGGDSVTDSSGSHFTNFSNLQNTRDNLRQAVSDLFTLTYALQEMNVAGDTFDTDNIFFLGHSMGAIVGTAFIANEPNVKASVLANGGASLVKLMDGSAAFGPVLSAGLAQPPASLIKGTADYESFLGAAQTVIDSADPVNHAKNAAVDSNGVPVRGVLFFEIVGGNGSPSDLVVPIRVPDANDSSGTVPAPLAGTEPQLALMGLTQVDRSQGPSSNLQLSTKFISGNHRSVLDPTADPLVTTEMQTQMATFFATDGAVLTVTDSTLLQAPAVP